MDKKPFMFDSWPWALFKSITVILPLVVGRWGSAILTSTVFDLKTDGFALQIAIISAALGLLYFFIDEGRRELVHIQIMSFLGAVTCSVSAVLAFADLAQRNALSNSHPILGYWLYTRLIAFSCVIILFEMLWMVMYKTWKIYRQNRDKSHPGGTVGGPSACAQSVAAAGGQNGL